MHHESEAIQTFPSLDVNLNVPQINATVRDDSQVVPDHDEDMVQSLAVQGDPFNKIDQYEKGQNRLRSSQTKMVYRQKMTLEKTTEDGEMLSEMRIMMGVFVDEVKECKLKARLSLKPFLSLKLYHEFS